MVALEGLADKRRPHAGFPAKRRPARQPTLGTKQLALQARAAAAMVPGGSAVTAGAELDPEFVQPGPAGGSADTAGTEMDPEFVQPGPAGGSADTAGAGADPEDGSLETLKGRDRIVRPNSGLHRQQGPTGAERLRALRERVLARVRH